MSQLSTISSPLTSITSIAMGINSNQINANTNNNSVNNAIISSNNQSICCLIEDNNRCQRVAGNASYSKRIEKQVTQRKLRLVVDQRSTHSYICEHHKQMIQSIRTSAKRKRKDSEDDSNDVESDSQDVDLLALQVNTLRRYKRHYRIQTRPGLNKSQLAEVLFLNFIILFQIFLVTNWTLLLFLNFITFEFDLTFILQEKNAIDFKIKL